MIPYKHGWLVRASERVIKADQDLWRADRAVEAALAMPEDQRWEQAATDQRRNARRALREQVKALVSEWTEVQGHGSPPAHSEDEWIIYAYRVRMATLGYPDREGGVL